MKNYVKLCIVAIFLGIIMAVIFYQNLDKDVKTVFKSNDNEKIFVFQLGVFKNLDNAQKLRSKYYSGGIYKINDLYHVIVAVTLENKDLIAQFLQRNDINYVIKEEYISNVKLNKIKEYDKVIKSTDNDHVIERINKASVTLFLSD